MLAWLTVVVLVAAAAFGLTAAYYALRQRVVDDRLLLVLAILEVALLVQVVIGIVQGATTRDYEKPVFFAYLLTVPVVAPVAAFLALKEKSRSSMVVVVGSALVVGILVGRLNQIWSTHA